LGIERCGKINAANSGSESWTGIGVVAGVGAVVLIMQWPPGKKRDVILRSKLLQILQWFRSNCKTRNQLLVSHIFSLLRRGAYILEAQKRQVRRHTTAKI
jgi:hypothetical protein